MFEKGELELLEKIRKRPTLFLDKISIIQLRNYLAGYLYAKDEVKGLHDFNHDCIEIVFVDGKEGLAKMYSPKTDAFSDFVHDYYGNYDQGPLQTISLLSANEEEAFWKFFELLDAYLASEKSL